MRNTVIEYGPDQRLELYYQQAGPKLAIFHHGTPSPRPLSPEMLAVFAEYGYSVACPFRQGYGKSTAQEKLSMADNATLTRAVLNHLGADSFLSLGHSGGGPRVLADLALVAEAEAGITFASVGPATEPDFDPFQNLPEEELEAFERMRNLEAGLEADFEKWAAGYAKQTPDELYPEQDEAFKAWIQTPDARFRWEHRLLGFAEGIRGWYWDEYSMVTDWGFAPSDIRKPLHLVTGDQDKNVDKSNSEYLHSKVSGSTLEVLSGFEHSRIFSIEVLERALAKLA